MMKYPEKNSPLTVRISGVVLAAGESSRIGETKQLLAFRGSTILGRVIANARGSLLKEIIVVLGHDADKIQRQVDFAGVKVVLNDDYKQGQSSSLKMGLNNVSNRSRAAMFLLGDQPLVDECVINRMIRAYEESLSPIVIPVFAGRRGNPVVIGRELFGELADAAKGDAGARVLFNHHAGLINYVEMDSSFIHADVDTVEDYNNLVNNIKNGR
jgi:molybdenum cofactor cytidylyltransferase